MAKEIQFVDATGRNDYVTLTDSTGLWWNNADGQFETFNAPDWGDYTIPANEFGTTGVYHADMPNAPAGVVGVVARSATGAPAASDPVVAAGEIQWGGSSVLSLSSLAALAASAVWAFVTEGAFTAVQILRGIAAFVMGKASGGNTAAPVFRDLSDTKNRVSMTVDTDGNRTAVSRDLT